jgi:hypothetical protein
MNTARAEVFCGKLVDCAQAVDTPAVASRVSTTAKTILVFLRLFIWGSP